MKKFLRPLLLLVIILAACIILNPTRAQAASASNLTFKLIRNGTSYRLDDCSIFAKGELEIPATYNDLPVTVIGDSAFASCSDLTKIVIPDSVTTIGDSAFKGCDSLTNVIIPNSVTDIGDFAFKDCDRLTNVIIPNSVTDIGDFAFKDCDRLSGIWVDENNLHYSSDSFGVLFNKDKTQLFQAPKTIIDYTVPDGVASIDAYAFAGCKSLNTVSLPESVTAVGNFAIAFCNSLTGIWVDENNPNYSCDSFGVLFNKEKSQLLQAPGALQRYSIPISVTTIGDYAFCHCESLTSVTIPSGVTTIGDSAFFCCESLICVTIPDSVTTIGDYAFEWCENLTSVTIPDSVTTIGDSAFCYCESLTSVTIPSGVTTIGDYAFEWCENLTSVTIPSSVTSFGRDAFRSCYKLISVTIADGVTSIGPGAFSYCESLTDITIPGSVEDVGYDAFGFCKSLVSATVLDGVATIDTGAFGECIRLTSVTIPDSVVSIGSYAFYNCNNLTSITIPKGVKDIGESTFAHCWKMTSIVIPDSVTFIDTDAFLDCTRLKDVYYIGTQSAWNKIWIDSSNTKLKNAILHFVDNCDVFGHTKVLVPGKYATATESGLTDGKICSACGEIFVAQKEIPVIDSNHIHSYDNEYDTTCNACGETREVKYTFAFDNYRAVLSDSNSDHKNFRVVIYELGDKTVADPADEAELKAIDENPTTYWGASHINKILITDAGNYVLLLKYNVDTGAALKVPLQISVSADPKLTIDKNNKITVVESNGANINHRAVVYYLGDQTVEDIYDEAALTAIDAEPETVWKLNYINRLALTKGGNYVLHLCYNEGVSAKLTVAQAFTVDSIPSLSVDINNKVVVTEENAENRNHRAVVYYLGENTVGDPYDESKVQAAAVTTSKTYWGLSNINKLELKDGGNYVVHLYYNVGTSEKRTLALDLTLNERPVLSVSADGKLSVTYTDPEINNPRAYIYNVGDAEIADIYDEAALKAIATPTQVWGLSSILKKQLTPGTYVVHFYYSIGTSAKKTVALKVTI